MQGTVIQNLELVYTSHSAAQKYYMCMLKFVTLRSVYTEQVFLHKILYDLPAKQTSLHVYSPLHSELGLLRRQLYDKQKFAQYLYLSSDITLKIRYVGTI